MNSASAFCCASAPAIVTGLMAPASVNGVAMVTCPARASSTSLSPMGMSRRIGELALMTVPAMTFVPTSLSGMAEAIAAMAMASRTR